MTLADTNWRQIEQLAVAALKSAVFETLQKAALSIQESEPDDPVLLASVPRIAQLIENKKELSDFKEVFASFARSVGLWNYIDKQNADAREQIVAESVTVKELGGITLHREQIAALNILLSGKNLILSAPTSFGKSILIDALLLSRRYKRVAIVLPTIALLDEFRRRLVERFGATFDVIMHQADKPTKERVIFLGTQERLINRDDLGSLDLAVVDEFYKLDPARKDDRSVTLNAAVYRLLKKAQQFFFFRPKY
jgi:RAD3-like DEAD/DEAH box helicase